MTALNKAVAVSVARSLDDRLEELRDKALDAYARVVQVHLQELEERYPRHKFRFVSGMGTTFFVVSPPFMGQDNISPVYFPQTAVPPAGARIVDELFVTLNHLIGISEHVFETWRCELGNINSEGIE